MTGLRYCSISDCTWRGAASQKRGSSRRTVCGVSRSSILFCASSPRLLENPGELVTSLRAVLALGRLVVTLDFPRVLVPDLEDRVAVGAQQPRELAHRPLLGRYRKLFFPLVGEGRDLCHHPQPVHVPEDRRQPLEPGLPHGPFFCVHHVVRVDADERAGRLEVPLAPDAQGVDSRREELAQPPLPVLVEHRIVDRVEKAQPLEEVRLAVEGQPCSLDADHVTAHCALLSCCFE